MNCLPETRVFLQKTFGRHTRHWRAWTSLTCHIWLTMELVCLKMLPSFGTCLGSFLSRRSVNGKKEGLIRLNRSLSSIALRLLPSSTVRLQQDCCLHTRKDWSQRWNTCHDSWVSIDSSLEEASLTLTSWSTNGLISIVSLIGPASKTWKTCRTSWNELKTFPTSRSTCLPVNSSTGLSWKIELHSGEDSLQYPSPSLTPLQGLLLHVVCLLFHSFESKEHTNYRKSYYIQNVI